MTDCLLETHRLGIAIAGQTVCRELELRIEAGQFWGILGRNGVGKTTLLLTLAGLREPQHGSLVLDGTQLGALPRRLIARRVGVLFQHDHDAFPSTVLETALIGRHPHLRAWQWESAADHERARAALHDVGLSGLEQRLVSTLSGGERRRLAVATLLTQDPSLLLLDEPTSHLDLHQSVRLLEQFRARTRIERRAALVVIHDINLASRYCDHVLLLHGEGVTQQGPTGEVLTEANLTQLLRHRVVILTTARGQAFVAG